MVPIERKQQQQNSFKAETPENELNFPTTILSSGFSMIERQSMCHYFILEDWKWTKFDLFSFVKWFVFVLRDPGCNLSKDLMAC